MVTAMPPEPFAVRVQTLRDAWIERRQVKAFAGSHERPDQLRLLNTVYEWADGALHEIRTVYGDTLPIDLSPPPAAGDSPPGFHVVLASAFTISFALAERRRGGAPSWCLSVSIGSPGRGGAATPAGPERRNGQWTRARLEELLLGMLGAYERSLAEPVVEA